MYDDLTDLVYDLAEQSNAQRAAALGAIDGHVQEFQGGIERMEVAVRRLEELFEQGGGHVLTEGTLVNYMLEATVGQRYTDMQT
jgi:hypothetical protein